MSKAREKNSEQPVVRHLFSRRRGSAANEPAREEIEQRAYELYLARGATDGYALEDWLQAERELS